MNAHFVLSLHFFRTNAGREPVRDWLKDFDKDDRKSIGEDIKLVQFRWPLDMPLVRKLEPDLCNDSVRIFSRELKKEMFTQSPVCQLCGNEIKLIDDAALDHALPYWRGGKTVPDNARLVHRHCNATRKNHES